SEAIQRLSAVIASIAKQSRGFGFVLCMTGLPRPCGPRNDNACGLFWSKELIVPARSTWLMDNPD
ncbi:MAG: hypothetical protein KGL01_10115, partial [Betaproteobacteria bacterium]|nr:hypothetical protein [Betaproteobacteria bacterium]